jgi:hypothetical protein
MALYIPGLIKSSSHQRYAKKTTLPKCQPFGSYLLLASGQFF